MASLLQVTGLTKVYGKRGAATRALDGVDLSLEAGEYVGIMGASGSGKTTLLNCVSTIDKPTSGSILVEGRELVVAGGSYELCPHAAGCAGRDCARRDCPRGRCGCGTCHRPIQYKEDD